jgi:exopolysaccharide biosynthesis polyprenyl glycosylphosphotransferase
MLRENWRLISRIEQIGDCLIIVVCFFLAYYGRSSLVFWDTVLGLELSGGDKLAPINTYLFVLGISLIGYLVTLNQLGGYASMRLTSPWRLLWISLLASVLVFMALASVIFLLKLELSRSFIGLFCILVGLLLTAERYVVLRMLRFWRKRGRNFRNVIVVGTGEQAHRLALELSRRPELGLFVRAFGVLGSEATEQISDFRKRLAASGYRYQSRFVRGPEAIERALKEYAIDEMLFTDIVPVMEQVEELVLACSEQGVRTTLAADLFSFGLVRSDLSYFGSMPLIHFQTPPGDRWELSIKRVIDVVVAALLLVLLAPVLAVLALAVKLSSPGTVLFRQRRLGLNGRSFELLKFRSMNADAEEDLESLRAKNEMSGPAFKLSDDPRVTRVGKFLRRYSLDELPQLWNVLVGEMSLVGPRPPIPGEVAMYRRRERRRLSMRPGMTCLWQVSGRNEIRNFEDWVKLDLSYIDNWSLTLDLLLLLRTVPAVLRGTGR